MPAGLKHCSMRAKLWITSVAQIAAKNTLASLLVTQNFKIALKYAAYLDLELFVTH